MQEGKAGDARGKLETPIPTPRMAEGLGCSDRGKEGSQVLMERLESLYDISDTCIRRVSYQEAGFNLAR